MPDDELAFEIDSWVAILYELAATFHQWPAHRYKLLELATPLYNARIASFVNRTGGMNSREAEVLVEEQALAFEKNRTLLDKAWGATNGLPPDLDKRLSQS
jgi:hypothetical protein